MEENKNNQEDALKKIAGDTPNASQSADVEKNKMMAIIGYILPFLFFIPLVTDAKDSKFAKFHANQQLVLLIGVIAVNVIGTIIPILGWFIILPFGSLALFVLAIIGLINAAKGEMKKMPLIGGFDILK